MHPAPACPTAAKAGDAVVGVRQDVCRLRNHAHLQAMHVVGALWLKHLAALVGDVLHTLGNQGGGLGVQVQGLA